MESRRSDRRNQFYFFINCFIAIYAIGLSVYVIDATGVPTTNPLSFILWFFMGLAGVCGISAIISGWLMFKTPKDTRLDELIVAVKALQPTQTLDFNNISKQIDNTKELMANIDKLYQKIHDIKP